MDKNTNAFDRAEQLLKHLSNNLDESERADLEAWLAENEQNRSFFESIENEQLLKNELRFFTNLNTAAAWENIKNKTEGGPVSYKPMRFLKYAAAIIIFLSIGITFYWHITKEKPQTFAEINKRFKNDVNPGTNKATLTLADGSIINLEDLKDGDLRREKGIIISKKNGQVIYQVLDDDSGTELAYNTITTPVGGQFQIVLPDGSHIWLNAASSIRYPTAFKGKKRQVELNGEAYFEVAKNKNKPFTVVADNMEVEVLGTHFNVMAYKDEATVNTTLLEGSVRVIQNKHNRILTPGQEAVYQKSDGSMNVRTVELDQAIAWKRGLFLFNDDDLSTIMRQLSRWYNIEIEYRGQLPNDGYTGLISRNSKLSNVLNMLEMAGGVQFEIDKEKVKITKTK